jgi:hypothetical protein
MNMVSFRKRLIAAFGGTGNTRNEDDFQRSLITAVTASTVKSKPAVVALVALGGTITGATANDTMTAVADATAASTDTSAASLASVNTAIAAIENNLADLQTKVNAIIAALKA